MNKKIETAGFPYPDRPMWLYSRSSDKRMFVSVTPVSPFKRDRTENLKSSPRTPKPFA